MKKILITGICGFVGNYLSDYLLSLKDYEVYGTKLFNENFENSDVKIFDMDITDISCIRNVIEKVNPDYVIHLAAQSSVKFSWDNPALTAQINFIGTINLFEELRKTNPSCRVLLIGSSEEYGETFKNISSPSENEKCIPGNIYALTKNAQNKLGYLYSKAYNMNIVMTRSFNHFGENQSPVFVISDFCKQVAEIEAGLREPTIYVGNLESCRDFLNVKDVVRAYLLLLENGKSGQTYNVGSGNSYKIGDILQEIISMSEVDINIEIDKNKYRIIDIAETKADISKLKNEFSWSPKENFHESLEKVLNYWRNVISVSKNLKRK